MQKQNEQMQEEKKQDGQNQNEQKQSEWEQSERDQGEQKQGEQKQNEQAVKELVSQYMIRGYFPEGKIRKLYQDAESPREAEKEIKKQYEEASQKRETAYQTRLKNFKNAETAKDYENVKESLEALDGYKDCETLIKECAKKAEELRQEQIAARREEEKELEQDLKEHFIKDKRTLRWNVLGAILFIIINTIVLLWIGDKIMWM